MAEFSLVPHPDFPSVAVDAIRVSATRSGESLSLTYTVDGDLDGVRWPESAAPIRTDELWKHTCFEAFIGHPQAGYTEFNFSPSGAWATYFFDGYRDGMRLATWLPSPVVDSGDKRGFFVLETAIDLTTHWRDGASFLALSAIVEATDGSKSYWALAHAPGPPDFHNADCFIATLPAPDAS